VCDRRRDARQGELARQNNPAERDRRHAQRAAQRPILSRDVRFIHSNGEIIFMADYKFTVVTGAKRYGVKIRPEGSNQTTTLSFNGKDECTKTLADGVYGIAWGFFGDSAKDTKFALTITDQDGNAIKKIADTAKAGEKFGHGLNAFRVPKQN
jgi:hypothetical protein